MTSRTDEEWRDLLRDRAAWNQAVREDLETAEEANAFLIATISHVDLQLSHAKAERATRMPQEEFAELMEWRAQAVAFRRVCDTRRRALAALIKQMNRDRAEAESIAYAERRKSELLADVERLVAEWGDKPAEEPCGLLWSQLRDVAVKARSQGGLVGLEEAS